MPSNKELINEANNLADELELSVQTDGLKNEGLAELVSDLRAKKRDADTQTQADDTDDTDDTDESGPLAKIDDPRVTEGRSVTTKRGIIGPGGSIRASDLSGGESSLRALVKNGAVKV
jgi:hypothetical protein